MEDSAAQGVGLSKSIMLEVHPLDRNYGRGGDGCRALLGASTLLLSCPAFSARIRRIENEKGATEQVVVSTFPSQIFRPPLPHTRTVDVIFSKNYN